MKDNTVKIQTLSSPRLQHLIKLLQYRRGAWSTGEKLFIEEQIIPLGCKPDSYGNFWKSIPMPDGKPPRVMFACHTDTMDKSNQDKVGYMQNLAIDENTHCLHVVSKESNCLGADDAAGVFIMQEMIKKEVPGLYIFHRAEEIGCLGSRHIARNSGALLQDIKAVISFDRKDYTNVITRQMGRVCCSDQFAMTLAKWLGRDWRPDPTGMVTDSAQYMDFIPECTNLSVGYFQQHTMFEYQNYQFLLRLSAKACRLRWHDLPIRRDPKLKPKTNESWAIKSRDKLEDDLYHLVRSRPRAITQFLRMNKVTREDILEELAALDATHP